VTRLFARIEEGIKKRHFVTAEGRAQRSLAPAQIIACAIPRFGFFEEGKHAVPVPARIAELAPFIVVAVMATHIDLPINRRTAAENATPRQGHVITAKPWLGLALELPVDRTANHEHLASRHMNKRVPVARARLKQQYLVAALFAEPIGKHTAGRTAADDDEVKIRDRIGRHVPPQFSVYCVMVRQLQRPWPC